MHRRFCNALEQISGTKSSSKIGSSFSLKKQTKSFPAVHIDDDTDLIDEDTLLSEEDLKKPQLRVGKTALF